jgi:hypothetical protein
MDKNNIKKKKGGDSVNVYRSVIRTKHSLFIYFFFSKYEN